MTQNIIIILIAIVAMGIFVVGMSLTIIFKGHYIDSEIGDNENMKKRGIKCAAQQMREEERVLRGETADCGADICTGGDCSSCGTPH